MVVVVSEVVVVVVVVSLVVVSEVSDVARLPDASTALSVMVVVSWVVSLVVVVLSVVCSAWEIPEASSTLFPQPVSWRAARQKENSTANNFFFTYISSFPIYSDYDLHIIALMLAKVKRQKKGTQEHSLLNN